MVISCDQNLYFKIQCKKPRDKIIFHHNFDTIENSHNNMNMKITAEVCTSPFY